MRAAAFLFGGCLLLITTLDASAYTFTIELSGGGMPWERKIRVVVFEQNTSRPRYFSQVNALPKGGKLTISFRTIKGPVTKVCVNGKCKSVSPDARSILF